MVRRYLSTPATATRYDHAEGPCWDARTGQLLWVDQYEGHVLVADYDPATAQLEPVHRYDLGHPVGAVVPCGEDAGWLAACAKGFAHVSAEGTVDLLAQPEAAAPVPTRMNDGKCDDLGRFWAGSMAWDKTPGAGSLYRLDPDQSVTVMLRGVTISNGLAWSADGHWLYYIDTPTRRIDRFRVRADGQLSDRSPLVAIEDGAGEPDGMCIDIDGCLWVALWGGSAVRRYSADGELLASADVAAPLVSSCCLGGPAGTTLFVTTSQENMGAAERAAHPNSGRLFCVTVETPGRPAASFGAPKR